MWSALESGALVWLRWLPIVQVERARSVPPPSSLAWGFPLPGSRLLWAERGQSLAPHADGCTDTTTVTIGGMLLPLVHRLFGGALQDGSKAMTTAFQVTKEARCTDAAGGSI